MKKVINGVDTELSVQMIQHQLRFGVHILRQLEKVSEMEGQTLQSSINKDNCYICGTSAGGLLEYYYKGDKSIKLLICYVPVRKE